MKVNLKITPKKEEKFINEGDSYEDDYKNGMREGNGIYKWISGNMYEGEFINNRLEG